ncbi:MAG: DUF1648 domain-containing protein, partial [Firmicutes bacterium]|nr:DUF1648 domain-containing protein [Bacillota bacterium]
MTLWVVMVPVDLLVLVLAWWMPRLADPTLPLGVRIPPDRIGDPALKGPIRFYHTGLTVTAFILVAAGFLAARPTPLAAGILNPILLLFGVEGSYILGHYRLAAVKRSRNWYRDQPQALAAEVPLPAQTRPGPRILPALMLGVILCTAVIGILRYPALPPLLAVHFTFAGRPDSWMIKSVGSAFLPVWTGISVWLLFTFLSRSVRAAGPDLDPHDPSASAEQRRRFSQHMVTVIWILGTGTALTLLLTALITWGLLPPAGWTMALTLIPILLALVPATVVVAHTGQGGSRLA